MASSSIQSTSSSTVLSEREQRASIQELEDKNKKLQKSMAEIDIDRTTIRYEIDTLKGNYTQALNVLFFEHSH